MKIFNKQKFYDFCRTGNLGKKIFCFKTINSTNDHACLFEDRALKLNKNEFFFNINKEKLLACILKYFEINYENYIKTGDLKTIFLKIDNSVSI